MPMIRLTELKLPLDHSPDDLLALAARTLGLTSTDLGASALHIHKRSFDARMAQVRVVYIVDVDLPAPLQAQLLTQFAGHAHIFIAPCADYTPTAGPFDIEAERPVVVGFGPCGIFAALLLAQMGLRPIVLERGKSVRQRTQDTWGLWRKSVLHAESNVQFGEGGAGTFSDGKLYSQIKDPRHLGRKVMQEFVKAGAPPEILVDAHPHIGTFKLVKVVENLRAQIIALGGEIRFEQRMVDLLLDGSTALPTSGDSASAQLNPHRQTQQLRGLQVLDLASNTTYTLATSHAVLALGHSARDSFAMLHQRGVYMQAKPFSIGFRIEHPQGVIDRARWGRHAGHPQLGAADYKLVHHAATGLGAGRSVYSFCMCPGGTVVAATSEPGRVVTNGMSQYSRNERNANAGIVVGIDPADFTDTPLADAALHDSPRARRTAPVSPLAGIGFQRALESAAFVLGGANYCAPAQRVADFLADRPSQALGAVEPSYKPGVALVNLSAALPGYAVAAIREAIPVFGKKSKGFDMADAMLTGVETRTSSPLKINRGDDFQSLNVRGLFPAGEGASYAGGILSAGVDGIKVAEAVARALASA
jgi:uncharacterized protein